MTDSGGLEGNNATHSTYRVDAALARRGADRLNRAPAGHFFGESPPLAPDGRYVAFLV
jgi:hypothetical protein